MITDNGGAAKALYAYNADGTKVCARTASGYGFDYLGSLIYQRDGSGTRLESALFGGGRLVSALHFVGARPRSIQFSLYEPEYYLTDHLGSPRVVVNGDNVVCSRNDYYPFGGRWNSDGEASTNRWQFNGKESQQDFGLHFLDYGARIYDSRDGRWLTQDPLSEDYYSVSPYAFCGGDPVNRIDPNGMDWYSYMKYEYDDEGNLTGGHKEYEYVEGTMSDREMKDGNYTRLGYTYQTADTYYSFGGAIIGIDPNNALSMIGLQQIMGADLSIINTINAMHAAGNFWEKYNGLIGIGADLGAILGDYMELSNGFRGTIYGWGLSNVFFNAFNDYRLIQNNNLHGIALSDACANVISLAGTYGAAISLGYSASKGGANWMMRFEQALRMKSEQIKNYYIRMMSF